MPEFDGYREIYEQEIEKALKVFGQPHDFFTKVKSDKLAQLFASHFATDLSIKVLDVGCGIGSIHPMLLERRPGTMLAGIDVAGDVVSDARRLNPSVEYEVYQGDILPYADASFDAVFTICVMHHVPPAQWPQFMDEMRRVVRPGGIVVVAEHNPLNPMTRLVVNNCALDKNAVLLRSSRLMELMQTSGLEKIENQFILFTPFAGGFFRSIEDKFAKIPFGAQYIACGQAPA